MSRHELFKPPFVEGRQSSSFSILTRSSQSTHRLKILSKFWEHEREAPSITSLRYSVCLPFLLLFDRWKLCTSRQDTCRQYRLPFEDFECQTSSNLQFKSESIMIAKSKEIAYSPNKQ